MEFLICPTEPLLEHDESWGHSFVRRLTGGTSFANLARALPRLHSAISRAAALTAPSRALAEADRNESELNRLMDRYAQGEESVFRSLHACLDVRLRRFLLRLSGSTVQADELSQECFLRMHRARRAFVSGSPALPWVYMIARNVFLDYERRRKVRSTVIFDGELADAQPDVACKRADYVVESRDTLRLIAHALARMPLNQREAFILLRFDGMSVSDAAEILGTTEGSVKSRAFRAHEAIRLVIAEPVSQRSA